MMWTGPWVVLLVAAVVAVVWALQRRDDGTDDVAQQVLDRRLAQGELTVEEHAERQQVLRERGHRPAPPARRWGIPMAVIVVAVLVGLLAWLAGAMPGRGFGGGWMGGHMGGGGSTSSTSETVEGAREVEVEAGDLWFTPTTIEMAAGEAVNVQLVNSGAVFHDLTVPAIDVVLGAEPGERASGAVELVEPGSYEFLCSVPGHARGGMRGTIVVTNG